MVAPVNLYPDIIANFYFFFQYAHFHNCAPKNKAFLLKMLGQDVRCQNKIYLLSWDSQYLSVITSTEQRTLEELYILWFLKHFLQDQSPVTR